MEKPCFAACVHVTVPIICYISSKSVTATLMALPALISGADCGPLNPLQSLSKQFDKDRGIQQVTSSNLQTLFHNTKCT